MDKVGSFEDWVAGAGGLRFSQLLDAMAEAITVRSEDDEIVFANEAALAQFGVGSVEQLRDRTTASTLGDHALYDEHGNPLTVDDLPSPRLLQRESPAPLLVRAVDRRSGAVRWWRMKSLPLVNGGGDLIGATTVIEDLTAVKTAEVRTRVLGESGRMLAASLDYEQTLRNVTRVAVPAVADWCAVDLIDPSLRRERLVFTPIDSDALPLATSLRWFQGERVDGNAEFAQVLRTGESILHERVTSDKLARWAQDAAALRTLRELDMCSLLVVPLRVPARTIGVMMFVTTESRMTREDRELGEQLGRRAAVAVENARLHARLRTVAETLERSLLPAPIPELPGWEAASLYRPVASELRIDVGGDFFELFHEGEKGFAIVGDVEGQGVTAATMTALMRYGARFAARFEPEPASILAHLDEVLRRHWRDATCTALCARVEHDRLVVGSAGHPPALVVNRSGEVRELPEPGPLLGAFADAEWPQQEAPVAHGETVLLYTDGVTDTLGERGRFGRDRLRALLSQHANDSPETLLKHLDSALRRTPGNGHDDLAALALTRR